MGSGLDDATRAKVLGREHDDVPTLDDTTARSGIVLAHPRA